MRNPVQTECGHLFCKQCLEPVLQRRRPICPLDKADISREGIFPDNACRREILHLDVSCNFMTSGCLWIGPLNALELHMESCEYCEVQCTQCGQYIQQLVLTRHNEVDCPMWSQPLQQMQRSIMREISQCMDYNNLRRQLLERATYHGILIWKIDDFERRRKEAVDGVTMSLYSSPFYTSRHGYKMCARVDLNGDGLGKNTHFSFFFVIMRGPYDPRLAWPFRQKVTLTLLNQTGKEHVTDHFRPVPHFSSFQRPGNETEMNIACGCPMFIQIEHLLSGGFVKDDAAYVCIRIEVDTSDLPKIIS